MNKKNNLSQADKKAWEDYVKNPNDIYDKDNSKTEILDRNYRFKFDLHGLTLDKANKKVKEIILFCIEKKYRELLLITGKGIHSTNEKDIYVSKDLGKLKYSVPDYILSDKELNNFITSINDADIKDGGKGAILIKLKKL